MLHEIDLSRTDLNLLVLFETVMTERHVRKAAERLNLSPSAVSHGLGRLRGMLGDPLFLKVPKGVVPTHRAQQLSGPVADILARVRGVIGSTEPFDPSQSKRRFTIGAPDAVSAVFVPPLLAEVRRSAPSIDLSLRQILPRQGDTGLVWSEAFTALESGMMDVAIIPSDDIPARFAIQTLFEEDFVIAMRAGHPYSKKLDLRNYCAAAHLVVSQTGETSGFVDKVLAPRRVSRRVALTVPNFLFALPVLAESDLISALPRRLVALHGPRFGIIGVEPPVALPRFRLNMVMQKAARDDSGLAWLTTLLLRSGKAETKPKTRRRSRKTRN